jgi:glycerate 2-kinase
VNSVPPAVTVSNELQLLAHGDRELRQDALRVVLAGIAGADPGAGTRRIVRYEDGRLTIGGELIDLEGVEKILVIGAGKASFGIAEALEETLGARLDGGVVVVKKGTSKRLRRVEVHEASHPLPDELSIAGAQKMLALAQTAGPRDLVFLAITGGASALATLPPAGIRVAEIRALTDLLLKCGTTIREINTVRRHLCLLKGGGLIAAVQPAEGITLTLDTAPEGLPWPDMCLADPSTFQDAIDVLQHYGLWEAVAGSIRRYLCEGLRLTERETVKSLDGMRASLFSVGDPTSACEAAAARAHDLGYQAVILSTSIEGEAQDVGVCLAGIAREITKRGRPFASPCAVISGGETTVTMGGQEGLGGPNQETALAFVSHFELTGRVAFAAVDSDGTDGPTDIAGGLVDWSTMPRAREMEIDIVDALRRHRSSQALLDLGDAIVTGHTGTNVMNLRVMLVKDGARVAS